MEAKLRIQKLDELVENKGRDLGKKRIKYKKDSILMDVLSIPTEYLVYNVHNHRIASMMMTHKSEFGEVNPETDAGKKLIEDFLWDSDIDRNKKTLESIDKDQQIEAGVVTRDGIIADGNRRCMIQNRIAEKEGRPGYFLAVILPDKMDDSRKNIMELETLLQLGQDEKVEYNSIQRYIHVHNLLKAGFKPKIIANMMRSSENEVKKNEEIYQLMKQCLESWGADKLFQLLVDKKLDGNFNDLIGYTRKLENGVGLKKDVEKEDVKIFKQIHWDYYRLGDAIPVAKLRPLGEPSPSKNGLFSDPEIWNSFKDKHFEIREVEETPFEEIAAQKPDLSKTKVHALRDRKYKDLVKKDFIENYEHHLDKRKNVAEADKPHKLLKDAKHKVETVEKVLHSHKEINKEVLDLADEIKKLCDRIKRAYK
jgi:hypothetical protein